MSYRPVSSTPPCWMEMFGYAITNGDEAIAVVNEDWIEFVTVAINEKIEREAEKHEAELLELESAMGQTSEMMAIDGKPLSLTKRAGEIND